MLCSDGSRIGGMDECGVCRRWCEGRRAMNAQRRRIARSRQYQFFGMQHQAVGVLTSFSRAVKPVADNRMTDRQHMDSQLVRASGFRP